MVLLSVDVGYFQAGWQIKMMRTLKKTMWLNIFKEVKVFSVKEKQEPDFLFLLIFSLFFLKQADIHVAR